MSRPVTVDTSALEAALGRGFDLDGATQDAMADKLAEASIRWTIQLKGPSISAPGMGIWPVGSILNLGARNERYSPDGRDSGRSLGAWDVDQKGLTVRATNTAVDARRNHYAEFVHFSGDPTGQAVDDAQDAFESEMARAAEEMADVIERALVAV